MQSKAQRYTFYAISIICMVMGMMIWSAVSSLWQAPDYVRQSGLTMPLTLFVIAWIYPIKKFNKDGALVGMHREALQASGLFLFIAISMPVEDHWGVYLPHWGSMTLFVGSIIFAMLLYRGMLFLLSRGKHKQNKVVEQDVALDG